MKTLALASGAVAVTWAALYEIPQPIPPKTSFIDKTIVYEVAVIFSVAALVMLISRRVWTIRGIGLFFSILALGVLFSNAVYVRQVGYTMRNNRVVPNTNPGVQEAISDLSRALLLIGGPMLLIGLVGWLYGRFGPHNDDLLPGINEERRSSIPRREEDRVMRAELADLKQRMEGTTT
jgi:hypothetical protein